MVGAQLDAAEGQLVRLSTSAAAPHPRGHRTLSAGHHDALVAGVCLSQWCFINASDGETQHTWLTRPLPLHDWRLRRIDLFSPMDSSDSRRVRRDLDAVVDWTAGLQSLDPSR